MTGDGIATFAGAFIYAGAPSIVASLWDVADEPTNRLLPGSYRRWLRGAAKARALREAQLQLLNELRGGRIQVDTPAGRVSLPNHPVFWAGFGLIGEPESARIAFDSRLSRPFQGSPRRVLDRVTGDE